MRRVCEVLSRYVGLSFRLHSRELNRVKNPAFLERSDLVPTLDFVLLGRQLCKVRGPEIATVSVTHNTVASHVEESLEPPRKKRKGVRFTDLEVEDM